MTLRHRLTLWLGAAFVAIWVSSATWLMLDLRDQVHRTLDDRLAASARMVAGLVSQLPESFPSESIATSIDTERAGVFSGLACRVTSMHGSVLSRSRTGWLPPPENVRPGFATWTRDGVQWRTFTLERNGYHITTSDRIDERAHLDRSILGAAAAPVLVALIGSLIVLWLGLARELRPLEKIRMALSRRHADSLAPLPREGLPPELDALVAAQNSLFARLRDSIERERRFTGDAAHELRSPLTALRGHVQVARLTGGPESRKSLDKAEQAAIQLQKTLDQLLLLARVEGDAPLSGQRHAITTILSEAIAHCGAASDRLDVRVRADDRSLVPALPAELAVAALRNLIRNALEHGPEGALVTVEVARVDGCVNVSVCDRGEGFQPEALGRFHRGRGSSGSGLGLSIVAAIVQRASGTLHFDHQSGRFCARFTAPLDSGSS